MPRRNSRTAHPRSRGEHYIGAPARMFPLGSSPLARGAQHGRSRGTIRRGLIPACAGSTALSLRTIKSDGAHPRSRGEHDKVQNRAAERAGSSPLARGTPRSGGAVAAAVGLIPARAGNTTQGADVLSARRAHPRSRGEHGIWIFGVAAILGSSPLARGTHAWFFYAFSVMGLIPARAGNTGHRQWCVDGGGAHPRSRGEHHFQHHGNMPVLGSSPLARGTPRFSESPGRCRGLIPARAGNTRWTAYP